MGAAQSTAQCLPVSKREAWLEQQCSALANENERLHKRLRELELQVEPNHSSRETTRRVSTTPREPLPSNGSTGSFGSLKRSGSHNNITKMSAGLDQAEAAISAAAEATAAYQSSLVSVEIDNETSEKHTIVVVRAPTRPNLLGDMSGALAGLGLAVRSASISNNGAASVLQFTLQEPHGDSGRKVLEPERQRSIEERLQQRFRGRQGLHGGVKRLVVERFIRADPPWTFEQLPAAKPTDVSQERLWLASLQLALGPAGGSSLGHIPAALAARCAVDLLPEMRRMRLPVGGGIAAIHTAGEPPLQTIFLFPWPPLLSSLGPSPSSVAPLHPPSTLLPQASGCCSSRHPPPS